MFAKAAMWIYRVIASRGLHNLYKMPDELVKPHLIKVQFNDCSLTDIVAKLW
jgi:hypothetical protein